MPLINFENDDRDGDGNAITNYKPFKSGFPPQLLTGWLGWLAVIEKCNTAVTSLPLTNPARGAIPLRDKILINICREGNYS